MSVYRTVFKLRNSIDYKKVGGSEVFIPHLYGNSRFFFNETGSIWILNRNEFLETTRYSDLEALKLLLQPLNVFIWLKKVGTDRIEKFELYPKILKHACMKTIHKNGNLIHNIKTNCDISMHTYFTARFNPFCE